MQECGLEISILPVIKECNNMINIFYYWLYKRLKEYHHDDFVELKKVIQSQEKDQFNFDILIDKFLI